jgi:hypothetical protein
MGRAGGKRNGEDPPNPFLPDAREVRNQRQSRRTSLRTPQSGLGQKKNLSQPSMRKKTNPNAPQHRPMSRPAEGRKEIPIAQPGPQRPAPQSQGIGNHVWRWNFFSWEDAKPFNNFHDFFSMSNRLFNKCNRGIDIKLNSQMFFENSSQTPIHEIKNRSSEGLFISECLDRIARFIRPGPGHYKVMHKDVLSNLVRVKTNPVSKRIAKMETENATCYVNERYTAHDGGVVDRVNFSPLMNTNTIGNKARIDFVKRAKYFRGAVIDTDGASLEKLFFQKNYTLEHGKINTSNILLNNFFRNIPYWTVGDKKLLVIIHPNYEYSIFNGIKEQTSFSDIDYFIRQTSLVYGLAIPPFFRVHSKSYTKPIIDYMDQDSALRLALLKELSSKMHVSNLTNQIFNNYKGKYPAATTYSDHVFTSFYISKNPRKGKRKDLDKFCISKSDKERQELFNGNDFIQCYEIEKISDYEIKVEQLKV